MKKETKSMIIRGILAAVLGNIISNWAGPCKEISEDVQKIIKNIPEVEFSMYKMNDKDNAMDYEKTAHLIAKNYLIKEGDVCREYAAATYHAYLNLCRKNNRKDLENKIRLAYTFKVKGLNEGHAWIEINKDKKWVPCDVANYPYKMKDELYKAGYLSVPGKNIIYPTLSDLGNFGAYLQINFPKEVNIDKWIKENVVSAENQ